MTVQRKLRLAYLVTHPIQYQAPLLRRINAEPDIDLTVFFGTDFSARPFVAADFGQTIEWASIRGGDIDIIMTCICNR